MSHEKYEEEKILVFILVDNCEAMMPP